jgi:hypothetical protein
MSTDEQKPQATETPETTVAEAVAERVNDTGAGTPEGTELPPVRAMVFECKEHGYVTDSISLAVTPEKKQHAHFCPFCLAKALGAVLPTMRQVGALEIPRPCTPQDVQDAIDKLVDAEIESGKATPPTADELRKAEPEGGMPPLGELGEEAADDIGDDAGVDTPPSK